MANDIKTVLPQGAGYAVVVGIGFFFAALMIGVSYIQVKDALPKQQNVPRLGYAALTSDTRIATRPIRPAQVRNSTLQVEM